MQLTLTVPARKYLAASNSKKANINANANPDVLLDITSLFDLKPVEIT